MKCMYQEGTCETCLNNEECKNGKKNKKKENL